VTDTPQFGLAIQYVSDIEAAKRFYVDVLGLRVGREHPTFVQFKSDSGASFAIAGDEPLGGEAGIELYWLVDDAEAAFADLSRRCEISLPLSQLPYGKVFGVRDPEGHARYLLEFAAERPSHAVS
jgi:catechol 2,3-dioxygenase-like lactoylglutathione lyase family enzyme